mmetsp:Transcript_16420/g.45460  ORF Transcript_16420/g.45460 Transcript_16420/m.45460 type:complete len:329 (-) Transcript_16420:207-1193(-)
MPLKLSVEAVVVPGGGCVGPGRDDELLEAVVRQREKLEHREHQKVHIREQIRVVRHRWGRHEQLASPASFEKLNPMPTRYNLVLLAVHHEQRRGDLLDALGVRKPLLEGGGREPTHHVPAEFLEGEHRGDQDEPRDLVLRRHPNGRAAADGSTQDQDAVQRPPQDLPNEAHGRKCVIRRSVLVAGTAGGDTVPGVLHCEDMNLELRPEAGQKRPAPPQVLGIAVDVQDDEARRGVLQEEARDAARAPRLRPLGPAARGRRAPTAPAAAPAAAGAVGGPRGHLGEGAVGGPRRHVDELIGETLGPVGGRGTREEQPADKIKTHPPRKLR